MFKVLYVDDEKDLLEIGRLFLEQSGDYRIDTCLAAPDALQKMRTTAYDAVISDYLMPVMDGIDFLKNIRSTFGDIPFILFTGRGREEVVIEAINNGADFYLQKGGDPHAQFAELAHKVRQAVARKRAERSLVESEKRLTDIINFLPDATFAIDTKGTVIAWNHAMEEMTGIAASAMLGKGKYEYAIPFYGKRRKILIDLVFESDEVLEKAYAHVYQEKDILIADTTSARPQGKTVTLAGKASPLYNRQGEVVGAIESIRDITQRERDAERIRVLNRLYSVLIATNKAIVHIRTKEEFFSEICRILVEIGGFRMAWIGLAVPAKKSIDPVASSGSIDGYLDTVDISTEPVPRGSGPTGTAYRKGIYNFSNDIGQDPKMEPWREAAVRRGYFALAAFPFALGTKNAGVITVYAPVPGFFDEQIINLLDEMARDISFALKSLDEEESRRSAEEAVQEHHAELVKSRRALRDSEDRYRIFVENADEGIWAVDVGFNTTFTNRKMAEILGYDPGEMLGHPVWDFVPPEDKPEIQNILRERRGGRPGRYEHRWLRKDGGIVWCRTSGTPLYSRSGQFIGSFGMFTDITERRKAEEALRESRGLYQAVFENTGAATLILDEDTTITLANTRFEHLSGYSRAEIEGKMSWTGFVVPEDLDRMIAQHRKRRTNPKDALAQYEFRFRNKAGGERHIHLSIDMIPGTTRSVASLLDITDRKEAEEAVRGSEEKFRDIFNDTHDAIHIVALDDDGSPGRFLDVNDAACRMLRYSRDELLKKKPSDLETGANSKPDTVIRKELREQGSSTFETVHLGKDGSRIPVEISIHPVLLQGTLVSIAVVRDITERKNAEEALRESEAKFRSIIENMQDIYYRTDREGILEMVSPAGAAILGYDSPGEIIGKNIAQTLYNISSDRELFLQELEKHGSVQNRITTLRKQDGSPFIVSANSHFYYDAGGNILGVEGILHDINELEMTRDALEQANKKLSLLSSITRHDSLNKLTILLSYLSLVEGKVTDPEASTYLSKAKYAGAGIRQQIEFTKVYQGLGIHDPQWENLGAIVGALSIPPGISLESPVNGVEVLADPLLVKVFENLLDNSIRHGETVTSVSVTYRESDGGLTVTYEDNGTGIPAEEKEIIFERGYGKNTGLGLFLVREILAITGMNITETGVPGSGARFEIAVPKGAYRHTGTS